MGNRAVRHAGDFYRTPPDVTRLFLAKYGRNIAPPARILEPCAGDGAMLDPLLERWPQAQIDAFDIDPQDPRVKRRIFYLDDTPREYDLVITNPPFTYGQGFASYGLSKLAPGGVLILLLPLAFMCSQERHDWLEAHMPHHFYPVSKRIDFKGDGKTDMRDCAWFVWRENGGRPYCPQWSVL